MKHASLVVGALLAGVLLAPDAFAQRKAARGVTPTTFNGWSNALLLESRDAESKAVIVPGIGGRVMSYGLRGENLLWVNPDAAGKTPASGGGDFQPGGFACDVGPEVAGVPPHPNLLTGPFEASPKRPYTVLLKGAKEESIQVEFEKEVVFDPANGDLGFVHRMKNTGERDSAFCFAHRIACKPGGFVLLPLNKRSRFAAGWSMRRDASAGNRASYDGETPTSDSVQILDGVLVAQTGRGSARIGADSDGQWVAYVVGRDLFIVHFPIYSSAVYSEGGNTVTVAWNEQFTEIQPLSPEARLRSRKSYDFPMKWSIMELPAAVTTPEQARALVDKIPGSPFL